MRVPQRALRAALPCIVAAALVLPGRASRAEDAGQSTLDVDQLFGTTCGWCHSDGGRTAGKGPQLMNTTRTDDFIRNRIKHGKQGAMPAFGSALTDADIDKIIVYIRALKPTNS
jgi:mono/diheme cytochrome c family protein